MMILALLLACGHKDHDHTGDTGHMDDTGHSDDTGSDGVAVTLNFRGVVGDQDFACGTAYTGMGTTGTTWTPSDARLYVHDVHLVDASGAMVPVTLTQDGLWQYDTLALLDFEDKTATCANGTTDVNTQIVGTVPAGTYVGVGFTVGVPFALNHADAATAASPLNLSTMFWSWQSGYKFVRVDGVSTGLPGGAVFHLGSTMCEADDNGTITACDNPNRAAIHIDSFDPAMDTVLFDIAALFADADLDTNQEQSMSVCMSDPADLDCAPIFASLGLGFAGAPDDPSAQTVFRKE
jgi:uncharacterized repeat protein (TIGR04052 family)